MSAARRLLHLARVLGAAALLALGLVAGTPLTNRAVRALSPPARLEPADAIVVLGGGVDPVGTLGDSSLRRLVHGLELYRRGLAPRLVVFGPGEGPGAPREAEVRARLAVEVGIPREALVVDATPPTTRAEASSLARLLAPPQGRRILLVTGLQHQLRAGAIFAREGFVVLPAPVDEVSAWGDDPEDRLRLARGLLQEMVARAYYRLAGYL